MFSMVVGLLLASSTAPLAHVDEDSIAWLSGGFSSTWVVQIGGGKHVTPRLRLDVQLETPIVRPLVMGGRLAVGSTLVTRFNEWFVLGARLEVGAPWASDFLGSWVGVDARLSVLPALSRPTWSLAVSLSVMPTIGVSWTPSLVVRDLFGDREGSAVQSPTARGIGPSAFRLEAGLATRVLLGGAQLKWWLTGAGGLVATPGRFALSAPPTSTLPFHATLGVLCAF